MKKILHIALIALSLITAHNHLKGNTKIIARKGTIEDWNFISDLVRTTYIPIISQIKMQIPIDIREKMGLKNAKKYTNKQLCVEKKALRKKKIDCVIFSEVDISSNNSKPIAFISFFIDHEKKYLAHLIRYSNIQEAHTADSKQAFFDYLSTHEEYQNLSYLLTADPFPEITSSFKDSYIACLLNFGFELVEHGQHYHLKLK